MRGDTPLRRYYCNQYAFTLVELLMVVALLGVLAMMSIPLFSDYVNKAKDGATVADLRTIEKSITAYIIETNTLPASLQDVGFSKLDPWQNPYSYTPTAVLEDSIGEKLNTDYDLYSRGSDGQSSNAPNATTDNDIVRTNNGNFAGSRKGL